MVYWRSYASQRLCRDVPQSSHNRFRVKSFRQAFRRSLSLVGPIYIRAFGFRSLRVGFLGVELAGYYMKASSNS